MQCSVCGHQFAQYASTCPNCGQSIPKGIGSNERYLRVPSEMRAHHNTNSTIVDNEQTISTVQQIPFTKTTNPLQFSPATHSQTTPDSFLSAPKTPFLPAQFSPRQAPPETPLHTTQIQQPFPSTSSLPHTPGLITPSTKSSSSVPLSTSDIVTPALRPGIQINSTRNGQSKRTQKLFVIISVVICLLCIVGGLAIWQINQYQPGSTSTTSNTNTINTVAKLPALTTTDPGELYNQATARPAMVSDTLKGNGPFHWQATNTVGTCMLNTGSLHVYSNDGAKTAICLADTTPWSNIAFQAQVTIKQGDTAGLLIHADKQGYKQYLFGITTNGNYFVALINQPANKNTQILDGGISSAITTGKGQSNTLTVIAHGTTYYFYANKQFLVKVDSDQYKTGLIGFFAADPDDDTAEATVQNATVWSV